MSAQLESLLDETRRGEDAGFMREQPSAPNWVRNLRILWDHRKLLIRAAVIAFLVNIGITLLIPNTYVSVARIMPPETKGSETALLSALSGRSIEGELLGGLAAGLMGGHNTGALFVDLLRSGSVTGRIIDRFDLQHVYRKRYRVDAGKALVKRTEITQDKKSGVITIAVKDQDRQRARDIAQEYLAALNAVVYRTSASPAHQERVFIERRLAEVKADLERAQSALSDFSSSHEAIDLKEQAKATVESEARVNGELIVAQGELESLQQVYGDGNVRVRAAEARVGILKRELERMGGSAAPLSSASGDDRGANDASGNAESYLPLRQVPRLAVPYADLYREVQVQETVYNLLTQQCEISRIEEAKDVPAVNVIDSPGIPEKKSSPPRSLLTLALTAIMMIALSGWLILREHWSAVRADDPRKAFAHEIAETGRITSRRFSRFMRRSA